MKSKETLSEFDKMKIFQNRFEMITASKLRDKAQIKKASENIDRIRAKTKRTGSNSAKLIRKWRDSRYCPSNS